ncbi:MAG: rhomboid family intramembrane serine protease [Oscillospiraceae bacterium]|nr:rhomboid family intramembrane serine protease [Oscillospiraceae bacterium]
MRILDKLERKFGWFAVRNLTVYLVGGNALVWLMGFVFPDNVFVSRLVLAPAEVFKGEVWRIVTFIFLNSFGASILSLILELYFLFIIGRSLESSWGSFRLTLFYFIGFALTVAVSFLTGYPVWGARYIHLSLFLAFASLAPEMRILLFFIIPVKIKWLAWAAWAFLAYSFVVSSGWAGRLFILAPLAAYALFFGPHIVQTVRQNRRSVGSRREFERKKSESRVIRGSFHKCEVCGITELDDPNMDFRYCSKCEGNYEYCSTHLQDHYHRSG